MWFVPAAWRRVLVPHCCVLAAAAARRRTYTCFFSLGDFSFARTRALFLSRLQSDGEVDDALSGLAGARVVDAATEAIFNKTNRTAEDVDVIYRLASTMSAFERYAEFTRRALCKVMRYCKFDGVSKRVVFFEGDAPDGFYFVLSGTVSGLKRPVDLRANATDDEILNLSNEVFSIARGYGFGEGAMQRVGRTFAASGRRGATMVCNVPCELLKVELEDYFKILSFNFEQEIEEKVEFLRRMPLFDEWTHARLVDVAKCMTTEKHLPNKIIYQQDEDQGNGTSFYAIRSGSCRVVKEIAVERTDRSGKTSVGSLFLHVSTLEAGMHFGEYAILFNCRRSSSVYSATKTTLYKLPKAEFDKFITDKTRERLLKMIEAYPPEDSFFAAYREQQAWGGFKQRVLHQTVRPRPALAARHTATHARAFDDAAGAGAAGTTSRTAASAPAPLSAQRSDGLSRRRRAAGTARATRAGH